jgi:hypothetical protein
LDYYAYNPEAAEHEFYTAADLDPHLAMAYWGIALSNAPNLNVAPTDDRGNQAREAIRQAKADEANAIAEDRALIDAAAARFDDRTKVSAATLLVGYRDALSTSRRRIPPIPMPRRSMPGRRCTSPTAIETPARRQRNAPRESPASRPCSRILRPA